MKTIKPVNHLYTGAVEISLDQTSHSFYASGFKDFEYISLLGNAPQIAALKQGIVSGALLASPSDFIAMISGMKRNGSLRDIFKDTAFTGMAATAKRSGIIRNWSDRISLRFKCSLVQTGFRNFDSNRSFCRKILSHKLEKSFTHAT
jgi:hypothetical protein